MARHRSRCFISAIRLLAHASVSVGAKAATVPQVIAQVDGTPWLVIADIGTLLLMYAFDSAPVRS